MTPNLETSKGPMYGPKKDRKGRKEGRKEGREGGREEGRKEGRKKRKEKMHVRERLPFEKTINLTLLLCKQSLYSP